MTELHSSKLLAVHTPAIDKIVYLRPGTSDEQVHADTFGAAGRYHLPPADMRVEPATVLDLGSNIGLTLAHYRHLWPNANIHGVELDAENAALARKNSGVPVWNHAIAAGEGPGYYDPGVKAEAYRLEYTKTAGWSEERAAGLVRVECRTLRKRILESFAPHAVVDFLKIDIEGAEWDLFAQGYEWAPLVQHLLVELHDTGAGWSSERIVERGIHELEWLGFSARHHPPHPQAVWAVRP